jgi:mRNA-degrading endonuclease YafQ of YafQ-DinJ toxin-antitoxin module
VWEVKIEDEAAKIFESRRLTDEDKIIIQKWARTVVKHGPEGLRKNPSVWADHALHGKWQGYRASSFSYEGRIIYKVEDQIITVTVVRITEDHDYRKKE